MVNINDLRHVRRQNRTPISEPGRKNWVDYLLNSAGLLASVLGPAFVVCFAGGSILLFAAIVFSDALGAVAGVMLYRDAARASVVSVVPSNEGEATDAYQLRPAA
jgi:hypothetical protein